MIFNVGPYRRSKLPVLNENFPADTVAYYSSSKSASATFLVEIAEAGKPDVYSYQWYLDGYPVGTDAASYTVSGLNADGEHKVICIVTNKAGSVVSREATLRVSLKYLFRSGDPCTDLTGGWTAINSGATINSGWDDDYYGTASVGASGITVTTAAHAGCYGGRCYTNEKVDLSDCDHLYFDYSSYGRVRFAVSNDQTGDTFVKSGQVSLNGSTTNWTSKLGIYDFDVAGLSGSYYIVIIGGTGEDADAMSATISRAWME